MLVLVGSQGKKKSEVAHLLAGKWFSDNLPDLRSEKDAALALAGNWLLEMAELSAMRKADIEHCKAFLTRTVDKFRPPYGRVYIDQPRQCVFIGTTNKPDFLRDETGSRRFWPVDVVKLDLDWLRENRGQLLAEAKHHYDNNEEWWPSGEWEEDHAKPEQSRHVEVDQVWLDGIVEYFSECPDINTIKNADLLRSALSIEARNFPADGSRKLAMVMNTLGWEKKRTKFGFIWVKG
jgi:predicted P-loop ATPase